MRAVLAALLLTACGGPVQIDEDLEGVVSEFRADCERYGKACDLSKGVSIEYVDEVQPLSGEAAYGFCRKRGLRGKWRVEIWRGVEDMYKYLKRATVYHELGHCVLAMDHADAGCYQIMSPRRFPRELTDRADVWPGLVAEMMGGQEPCGG